MALGVVACASNHQVSPFPPIQSIHDVLPPPDLDAQLRRIDEEAAANGYVLRAEQRGTLPDRDEIVIRAYETVDPFGRPAHLLRVATPVGIVLALGPPDPKLVIPPATELLPSLVQGGWFSGSDLNGDGAPEVVVRDGAGILSIFRIERYGAAPLPIELAWPPTFATDANGDGRPDFAASFRLDEDDPIAPTIVDVAIFDGARYSNEAEEARAFHAREKEQAALRVATLLEAKERAEADEDEDGEGGEKAEPLTEEDRVALLRAAIEQAFHALRAGEDAKKALAELDRVAKEAEPVPEEVRRAWEAWREVVGGAESGRIGPPRSSIGVERTP